MNQPTIKAGTHHTQEEHIRDYVTEWYPTTPENFEIDWADVIIEVDGRLQRSFGKARFLNDSGKIRYELKISAHLFDGSEVNDSISQVVRHEAIHIWQHQQNKEVNHGDQFQRWADRLDTHINAEERAADANWIIECNDCENEFLRHRKSRIVRNPDVYHCADCGGDLVVQQA